MAESADLVFQAVAWHADDVAVDQNDDDDDAQQASSGEQAPTERYTIKIFGVDTEGRRVGLTVCGFTPYFYVRVPSNWGRQHVPQLMEALRDAMGKYLAPSLLGARLVQRKDLWGFTNGELFNFVRFDFGTYRAYRTAWNRLEKPLAVPGVPEPAGGWARSSNGGRGVKLTVYEANIDPFIRFMHLRDIQPCGWVAVDAKHLRETTLLEVASPRTLDYETDWRHVDGADVEGAAAAPFTVASFDIECTSSHGDFPVPVKDYRKPAQELTDLAAELLGEGRPVCNALQLTLRVTRELRHAFGLPPAGAAAAQPTATMAALSRLSPKTPLSSEQCKKIDTAAEDIATIMRCVHSDGREATTQALLAKFQALRLPELEGDPVIQVGVTVHQYGAHGVSRRFILTLGGCAPVDGTEVRCFQTEAQLLLGFKELVQEVDPDVVTGYNILGFDFWYMYERAKELGVAQAFLCLGRLSGRASSWCDKKLSSSALGDNQLRYIDMEGRVIIDVMKVVQRDHKLDSYKLDHVASVFLNSNKHDVSPADICRLQRGSDADRAVVAAYCVQDCELCNRLLIKLETLANNIGMANVCLVPLSYIFMRGQGIKIFSLVLKQAKDEGFLVPVVRPAKSYGAPAAPAAAPREDDSYEGAIVLEPEVGIYTDHPVSVFDYASLYPSSMIAENLSQDTIVLNPRYDNLPGVVYENVSYEVYEGEGDKKVKVGERVCRYAQPRTVVGPDGKPNEVDRGLMPRILQKLLAARKATRKAMEQVDDPFQKAVLDGLQLAYKVTANSLYGQCGARTSPVYMKDIAACTTATGRRMILEAKKFLEENYCAQIIYGDSVAGYTPVTVRWGGAVYIETVESVAARFGGTWVQCGDSGREGKEALELDGLEVWSDAGWTRAHRLIRHRLAPHKRMLRVTTHTGVVDVTDDHSLLRPDASVVKPHELRAGERLLHADLPAFHGDRPLASSEHSPCPSGVVPPAVLWADEAVRRAFWAGLLFGGGCGSGSGSGSGSLLCSDHTSQVSAASLFALATSFGYRVSVSTPADNPEVTRLVISVDAAAGSQGSADTVESVVELPRESSPPFVYDFTTDNHHFAAGVGRIVVHNTDSLFCVFPHNGDGPFVIKERGHAAIMPSIQLAMQAQKQYKKQLKPPHSLEYEKTFWPFILLSKKRYVGNLYETDDKKFKQKSMGIVLKRRDNAPIVKRVYGGIIDVLLNRQDIDASVAFLRDCLAELEECRTPVEDLVVTKCLRADYKDPDRIAHKVLADRMAARDPGNKPQANDRIPYMYVQVKGKGKKSDKVLQGDRIEHPDYVRLKGLKPDTHFYITNQVMRPVLQLYATVVERLPGYRKPPSHYDALLAKLVREYEGDERKAREKLMAHKEKEVQELLFDPVLTRLENLKNGQGEITKFFKPAPAVRVKVGI